MKKLFLLLAVCSLIMCTGILKPKSRLDIIREKREAEIKSGFNNDTICLGFTFGMSQEEVNQRFKLLVEEGRLTQDKDGNYEYKISLDHSREAKANFSTDFINDSLYQLILHVNSHIGRSLQIEMANLFDLEYENRFSVPNIIHETNEDYIFLKGNLQIEIDYPILDGSDVEVEYVDFKMQNRKILQEMREDKDEKLKTMKDL